MDFKYKTTFKKKAHKEEITWSMSSKHILIFCLRADAPVNVKVEYQSTVKEGEEVRMDCSGDAHPPVSSYEWYNVTGARLYTGKVFVLQNVSRHHSEELYCTAINKLGRGNSNPVHLDVLCKFTRKGMSRWRKF